MIQLYTDAETRAIERELVDRWGIPEADLMERAGLEAWRLAQRRWPDCASVRVYCGSGNNGGDGWVVARLAKEAAYHTEVLIAPGYRPRTDVAAQAKAAYLAAGGRVTQTEAPSTVTANTLVIDALLGTGLRDAPRGWIADAINCINQSPAPVLSLDCPSGLDANTGHLSSCAVSADATLSFICPKRGLYTGRAKDFTGELSIHSLGVPVERACPRAKTAILLELSETLRELPKRRLSAHKGDAGHLLVIGGDHGMGGAALMAAESALRLGAGLVTLATRPAHISGALARRPELMTLGTDDPSTLKPLFERASAVLIGPGVGMGPWGRDVISLLSAVRQPLVLDADALNLIADTPTTLPANCVITPHPGEAGRLLACSSTDVEKDRFSAVDQLAGRYCVTAVLKGAGTLIGDPDPNAPVSVCGYGNPGMASGGMGDVLAGALGGLLAQGMPVSAAARLAVALHSHAADMVADNTGLHGLLATDLIPVMSRLLQGAYR